MGMGIWAGNILPGPEKTAFKQALTPTEQLGFADAEAFSRQWNANTDFAARGAAIADKVPEVAGSSSGGSRRPSGWTSGRSLLVGIWISLRAFSGIQRLEDKVMFYGVLVSKKYWLHSMRAARRASTRRMKLHLGPPALPRRG